MHVSRFVFPLFFALLFFSSLYFGVRLFRSITCATHTGTQLKSATTRYACCARSTPIYLNDHVCICAIAVCLRIVDHTPHNRTILRTCKKKLTTLSTNRTIETLRFNSHLWYILGKEKLFQSIAIHAKLILRSHRANSVNLNGFNSNFITFITNISSIH